MEESGPLDDTVRLSRSQACGGPDPPMLLVVAGESTGRFLRLEKIGTFIGRAGDSDVVLHDPGVSRRHALIARDDRGYLLRDLGSTNGVLLEGRAVLSQYLQEGDCFRCGEHAALKFGWRILGDDPAFQQTLLARLPEALRKGEFRPVYQPIVELHGRRIVGVEALVRWNSREGVLHPEQFLTLAEETGSILRLGQQVLQAALGHQGEFNRAGLDLFLTVNLSPRQLAEGGPSLLALVEAAPQADLVVDVTDSIFAAPESVRSLLAELTRAGVRIALDNFGHAAVSIEQLRRFQVRTLKLDTRLVARLPEDPEAMRVAVAALRLAESLNMQALAEGIEDARQYDFLFNNGYDLGQGFYFSGPLEASAVPRLVREGTPGKVLPGP